ARQPDEHSARVQRVERELERAEEPAPDGEVGHAREPRCPRLVHRETREDAVGREADRVRQHREAPEDEGDRPEPKLMHRATSFPLLTLRPLSETALACGCAGTEKRRLRDARGLHAGDHRFDESLRLSLVVPKLLEVRLEGLVDDAQLLVGELDGVHVYLLTATAGSGSRATGRASG